MTPTQIPMEASNSLGAKLSTAEFTHQNTRCILLLAERLGDEPGWLGHSRNHAAVCQQHRSALDECLVSNQVFATIYQPDTRSLAELR